jgi:hypothetical protein
VGGLGALTPSAIRDSRGGIRRSAGELAELASDFDDALHEESSVTTMPGQTRSISSRLVTTSPGRRELGNTEALAAAV